MTLAQIESIQLTQEDTIENSADVGADEPIRELSGLELALVGGGLGNMLLQ